MKHDYVGYNVKLVDKFHIDYEPTGRDYKSALFCALLLLLMAIGLMA